uniref:Soluble calcium-activated nucleotidase 1 n=1 Tax=Magallana gigas TaxID=29159 RepID=A0A8W8KH84_MAGGI
MMSSVYPTTVHEWMNAIRRPTPYRVGNARLHLKTRTLVYSVMFLAAVIILMIFIIPSRRVSRETCIDEGIHLETNYDYTYPLSPPQKIGDGLMFKIGLIADLDQNSKSDKKKNTWISYLHEGGRGMELSELLVFDGKLCAVDDRTGVVYHIVKRQMIPWVVLADGDGNTPKGFKSEWATVKNNRMYVGGLGKEWTSIEGVVENLNPQWVKSIGPGGDVRHEDWHVYYNNMKKAADIQFPGYIIHESGGWSEIHQRWFFLPRRASHLRYTEKEDERRGTDLMFIANEKFTDIKVKHIGELSKTRGFSSFKFIPETNDQVIVALKSEEVSGKIASYLTIFKIDGKIILKEKYVGDVKYEGIEFI